eukprot:GHUV01035563.1.p1 GENE.GHUV01035563.1~~GHUV01035563.1.p1  ORF type:complete len:117 (+),score=3.05 GHUV01035563.1:246-596(+)
MLTIPAIMTCGPSVHCNGGECCAPKHYNRLRILPLAELCIGDGACGKLQPLRPWLLSGGMSGPIGVATAVRRDNAFISGRNHCSQAELQQLSVIMQRQSNTISTPAAEVPVVCRCQ